MRVWVECQLYRRPFRQPLKTAHGLWSVREGILLKLSDEEGLIGFGEIAPIPWFGSESLAAALACCDGLRGWQEVARLQTIPAHLPACQFGVESAWFDLQMAFKGIGKVRSHQDVLNHQVCALLPAGELALESWQRFWQQGHRTFKWKAGVYGIEAELPWLEWLAQDLPQAARLRLDMNGGLTQAEAVQWLEACESLANIEFVEQPLPPSQLDDMIRLSQRYQTPLALDESVATLSQLKECCQRDWQGIYVIKPAICGYPSQVGRFIQGQQLDVVLSSALETGVGRQAVMALRSALSAVLLDPACESQRTPPVAQPVLPEKPLPFRALGFGTTNLFEDDWDMLPAEKLWEHL